MSHADLVVGLFGARGSGKSHTAKQYLNARRPARVLIWDTMNEYGAHARAVASLGDLGKLTMAPTFALRYVPRGTGAEWAERFGAFCALAYARGRLCMVVEELQRVTRPQWAPADWSDCTLRGRHRQIDIFGLSQRPAHVDGDFFGQCTFIRTGRLTGRRNRARMAEELDVAVDAVAGLTGHEWIGREMVAGRLTCEPADAVTRSAPPGRAEPELQKKVLPARR